MTVHGAPNSSYTVAQFGRSNANSQSEIFYIELEYSEGLEDDNPPSPPSTEPGTPPADDYLETIAALQKQIEQLTAELNDAKEEISKKDETIAELQSTNLELSYENDELRGELATCAVKTSFFSDRKSTRRTPVTEKSRMPSSA